MLLNGPIGLGQLEVAHSRLEYEPTPNIEGAARSLSGKAGLRDPPLDLLDRVREHWLRQLGEALAVDAGRRSAIVLEVREDLERWLTYYAGIDPASGTAPVSRPKERV